MKDLFNTYVKSFDLTVKEILGKYHHSFRVMEFAKEIAISLGLSDKDIELASICGLLHDIARFKQYTEYQTYKDRDSFDHGDVGYNILKNELLKDYNGNDKEIILTTTKYHNKFSLPHLDDRTLLFTNIVRDADKIDITIEQNNKMDDKEVILKKEMVDDILNNKLCKNKDIITDTDFILRELSWVNDLNFKYSFEYLKNNNIFENKFNLLRLYGETDDIKFFISKIKDIIYYKIKTLN